MIGWVGLLLWALTLAVGFWRLAQRQQQMDQADHAKCVAHIASVTSHRVVAQAVAQEFRFAAAEWDSVEEQANLRHLANERYTPGGRSMPAIWMLDRADKMEEFSDNLVYNMNGERVL